MARPIKKGLSYFPKDTATFSNRKIRRLLKEFGTNGYTTFDYILCIVYEDNGYFLEYNDELAFDISDFLGNGVTEEEVKNIINGCIKIGLINQKAFDALKIITSSGIQKRYLLAKRGGVIDAKHLVIAAETPINDATSTQSKVKETKENESKEKGVKENQPPIFLTDFSEQKNNSSQTAPSNETIFHACTEPCKINFIKYSPQYAWAQRDTEQLLQLLEKIKQTKKSIQNENNLIEAFASFLQKLPDYWRTKKFTIPHLNLNYNEIVSEIGSGSQITQGKNQASIKIIIPKPEAKREATPEEKLQSRKLFINSICEAYEKFKTSGTHGYLPLHVMYETLVQENVLILTPKQIATYTEQTTEKRKAELRKPKHIHEAKIFQNILENFNEEIKKGTEKNRFDNEVKTLAVQGLFDKLKSKNTDIKILFKN